MGGYSLGRLHAGGYRLWRLQAREATVSGAFKELQRVQALWLTAPARLSLTILGFWKCKEYSTLADGLG